jgi:hypothetical protein
MNLESAEKALRNVKGTTFPDPSFTSAIADGFTFAGQVDTIGAGMAIVLDAVGEGFSARWVLAEGWLTALSLQEGEVAAQQAIAVVGLQRSAKDA